MVAPLYMTYLERQDIPHLSWLFLKVEWSCHLFYVSHRTISWKIRCT